MLESFCFSLYSLTKPIIYQIKRFKTTKMKSLFQRQKEFFAQATSHQKATSDIKGARNLTATQALRIYQEAYPARLHEALLDKYKGVQTVLGDEKFRNLCETYITQHKSKTYNLSNYGEDFPPFLLTSSYLKDFPFLKDLAELERLLHQVFHCETQVPYQDIHPQIKDTSRFHLASYVRLPVFSYNIYEIWQATQKDEKPPQIIQKLQYLLLSKNKATVVVKVIDRLSSHLFQCFLKNQNLSEAIESASQQKNLTIDPKSVQDSFEILSHSQALVAIL